MDNRYDGIGDDNRTVTKAGEVRQRGYQRADMDAFMGKSLQK